MSLFVLFNGVAAPVLGFFIIFWDYIKQINFLFGTLIFCSLIIFLIILRDTFFTGLEFLRLVYENIQFSNATFEDIKTSGIVEMESNTLSFRIGKWTSSLSLLYQYPSGFFLDLVFTLKEEL